MVSRLQHTGHAQSGLITNNDTTNGGYHYYCCFCFCYYDNPTASTSATAINLLIAWYQVYDTCRFLFSEYVVIAGTAAATIATIVLQRLLAL